MEPEEFRLWYVRYQIFLDELRHNTYCDTPKKGKKKKNNPLNNKLSTPYLISNKSIALLREGVSRFFNITNLIPYSTMKANIY